MKAVKIILEIVAVLAAIAGVVYVVATYGDKIVAWAKKLLHRNTDCSGDCDDCEFDCFEDTPAEEDYSEEPAADGETVVAAEADFEG